MKNQNEGKNLGEGDVGAGSRDKGASREEDTLLWAFVLLEYI